MMKRMDDDAALMMAVKSGDPGAFETLVTKYQPLIMNLCYRYIGNQEDAEEVAQDVFIRVLRYSGSYEPKAKLSTYLYRIAVNLSINRIRDNKWKRFVSWDSATQDKPPFHGGEQPDELAEQREKREAIRRVIDSLPENQKTAVILKRFQELSYEEIAGIMRISVSAVESLLFRAKQTLKKKLKPFA